MGLAAMMANIMSQDKIFAGDKQRSGMAFNPDYKPARDRKELRKFRIKGEEVEAVIREIVPGMPEGNVRHAAELMCTDRMGNMMDIDVYILREEDRPYECHYLKDLLEDRVARIDKMHEDKSYTYNIDDNYWCATCGSHSHKKDSETGYCWHCDTVNWVKEDGADVRV